MQDSKEIKDVLQNNQILETFGSIKVVDIEAININIKDEGSSQAENDCLTLCTVGHNMEFMSDSQYSGNFYCDKCHLDIKPTDGYFHCGPCQYDQCNNCSGQPQTKEENLNQNSNSNQDKKCIKHDIKEKFSKCLNKIKCSEIMSIKKNRKFAIIGGLCLIFLIFFTIILAIICSPKESVDIVQKTEIKSLNIKKEFNLKGPREIKNLNEIGFTPEQVSSIRVKKVGKKEEKLEMVAIFDGKNFEGQKQEFGLGEYRCDTFSKLKLHGQTESIIVPKGVQVTLYQHCFGWKNQQIKTITGPKNIANLEQIGFPNNELSSMFVYKIQENFDKVTQFYGDNFEGKREELMAGKYNCETFNEHSHSHAKSFVIPKDFKVIFRQECSNNKSENDKEQIIIGPKRIDNLERIVSHHELQSLEIIDMRDLVNVFDQPNFDGSMKSFEDGEYGCNYIKELKLSDQIQSIRIPEGFEIEILDHCPTNQKPETTQSQKVKNELRCGKGQYITTSGSCGHCPSYTAPNSDRRTCIKPTCLNNSNQYITSDGLCKSCPSNKITSQDQKSCEYRKCNANQYLNINQGLCMKCPPYQFVSNNGESCEKPRCTVRQIITQEAQCRDCPDFHYPSKDKKECIKPMCSSQFSVITRAGGCKLCSSGQKPSQDKTACVNDMVGSCYAPKPSHNEVKSSLGNYLQDYNIQSLWATNNFRRQHSTPDLKFDPKIADKAQDWAQKLDKEGRFQHCSQEDESCNGCSENILNSNWRGNQLMNQYYFSANFMYRTGQNYDFNHPGPQQDAGRFVNIIWKESTTMGCGVSGRFVVCRYCGNSGNANYRENVLPKKAECNN